MTMDRNVFCQCISDKIVSLRGKDLLQVPGKDGRIILK
jgi:hypothetical protein